MNKSYFLFIMTLILGFFCLVNSSLASDYEILFQSATSTIMKIYTDPGGDGVVYSRSSTWYNAHNQSVGDIDEQSRIAKSSSLTDSWRKIHRGSFPVNTAILNESVEILSSKLCIYVDNIWNDNVNDEYSWSVVVQTNITSPTNLSIYDYNKIGEVDFPEEGSNRLFLDNMQLDNYNCFEMNSVGNLWINTTGFTNFGVRNGYDALNIPNPNTTDESWDENGFSGFFSESPGTDFDPYLIVRYKNKPVNPVIIIPGIMGSWELDGKLVMDPLLHTYDNLWLALSDSGYQVKENLFAFPYEWRDSNSANALKLKAEIEKIKASTSADKVDIVAHSMGGLVARSYIESAVYGDDVDRLVFLATPHQGATESYLAWEGGEFPPGIVNWLKELVFEQEAEEYGFGSIFSYVRQYPISSVSQLLPTYDYLRDINGDMLTYPYFYPANPFLDNLNQPGNMQVLEDLSVYNFVGQSGADSTLNILDITGETGPDNMWEHGQVADYEYSQGDTTVPARGNSSFPYGSTKHVDSTHLDIVTAAQKEVIEILTGIEPENFVDEYSVNLGDKTVLLFRAFSPVDFMVGDPAGQRIGKDFIAEENINELGPAYYSGYQAKSEFVFLPETVEGVYRISLQGIMDGSYRFAVDAAGPENCAPASGSYSGEIKAGDIQDLLVALSVQAGCPSLEVVPDVNKESLARDIAALCAAGEIKKKAVCNYLRAKARFLDKQFGYYDQAKNKLVKKLIAKVIILTIDHVDCIIDKYLKWNWLTEKAHSILNNDLDYLRGLL